MDIRKVKKLIELLEESGISELEISEGEESVRISRHPPGGAVQHYTVAAPPARRCRRHLPLAHPGQAAQPAPVAPPRPISPATRSFRPWWAPITRGRPREPTPS